MKKTIVVPLAISFILTANLTLKADVLADWTFETSQPSSAGPFNPESGLQTATAQASAFGLNTISSPTGNGSAYSFSGNGWSVGDYFQFQVNTLNFANIQISYDQVSSSSGPTAFTLAYSTDGVNFTSQNNYTVSSTISWNSTTVKSGTSYTDDLSSVTALNNAATVYFRLINDSSVGSGSTDRVDNFIVTAVPEASSVFLAALGGIIGFFVMRRRY